MCSSLLTVPSKTSVTSYTSPHERFLRVLQETMATPAKTTDVVIFLSSYGTTFRRGLGTTSTSEIVTSVVLPRTTNPFVKVTETTAKT